MRAIIIDPFACVVRETELTDDYKDLYRALSEGAPEPYKTDCFDIRRIGPDISLVVDDNGLLKPGNAMWTFKPSNGVEFPHKLAGCGVLVGSDGPDTVALPSGYTVEFFTPFVQWLDTMPTGGFEPTTTQTNVDTEYGKMNVITQGKPILAERGQS